MVVFDEGFLRDKPEQAKMQATNLKNVMSVDDPSDMMTSEDPLLKVFASVWYRIVKVSQL